MRARSSRERAPRLASISAASAAYAGTNGSSTFVSPSYAPGCAVARYSLSNHWMPRASIALARKASVSPSECVIVPVTVTSTATGRGTTRTAPQVSVPCRYLPMMYGRKLRSARSTSAFRNTASSSSPSGIGPECSKTLIPISSRSSSGISLGSWVSACATTVASGIDGLAHPTVKQANASDDTASVLTIRSTIDMEVSTPAAPARGRAGNTGRRGRACPIPLLGKPPCLARRLQRARQGARSPRRNTITSPHRLGAATPSGRVRECLPRAAGWPARRRVSPGCRPRARR